MPALEQVLKGRRILLTGSTGFLGKVFLAILLRSHPEIERVYLLIRGDRRSSVGRFRREILDSPVFAPLREHLGDTFPLIKLKDRLRCERCSSRQIVTTFLAPNQRTGNLAHFSREAPRR